MELILASWHGCIIAFNWMEYWHCSWVFVVYVSLWSWPADNIRCQNTTSDSAVTNTEQTWHSIQLTNMVHACSAVDGTFWNLFPGSWNLWYHVRDVRMRNAEHIQLRETRMLPITFSEWNNHNRTLLYLEQEGKVSCREAAGSGLEKQAQELSAKMIGGWCWSLDKRERFGKDSTYSRFSSEAWGWGVGHRHGKWPSCGILAVT